MLHGEPEDHRAIPRVVSLRKTSVACPSQWEGATEDGRVIYARYRHGHLSVGIGDGIREAFDNSRSDRALHTDDIGNGLAGFMEFEELKVHLHGLLEFPGDLVVENEWLPPPDPEALDTLLRPRD